ncbi:hypothetical protein SRHO_G00266030 [Serrasalmus rhombeus]
MRRGALVRSRSLSVKDLDSPTAFFFNLEKSSAKHKTLLPVHKDDGTVTTDPVEVRRLAVGFYSKLFAASALDQQASQVLLEDLPQLDEQHKQEKDFPLTSDEVTKAVSWLSVGDRLLVANNLITSALWHKFTVLNPPGQLIHNIQKALVNFFWNGQHWLRAAVLCRREDRDS